MRKIIATEWVTLDGFIASPDGALDWTIGDEEMRTYESELLGAADTLLLGRVTYEGFAGSWKVQVAHQLNAMRKVVFSKTLERVERKTLVERHQGQAPSQAGQNEGISFRGSGTALPARSQLNTSGN